MPAHTEEGESGWAVVTGGSRGIGRAAALALAERGHDVVVGFCRHEAAAAETAREVSSLGRRARTIRMDVADADEVSATLGGVVADCGPVSVLVNCAGITHDRTAAKLSAVDWQRVIDTNLSGCFHCCRALLPAMREHGFGRVVNVSSIIGQMGNVGQTNYAASKAGLIGFTKALSLETARHDITVNAICPGFIETDMLAAVPVSARQALLDRIPKGRFGNAREVARAIAFLSARESSYITGAVLNVNGGMYL